MTRRRRCFGPNYAWLHRSSVQQMYEKRVVTRRRSSPRRRRDAYRGSPRRVVISSRWVPTLNPNQFSWYVVVAVAKKPVFEDIFSSVQL